MAGVAQETTSRANPKVPSYSSGHSDLVPTVQVPTLTMKLIKKSIDKDGAGFITFKPGVPHFMTTRHRFLRCFDFI